jgi:hypothetical protein
MLVQRDLYKDIITCPKCKGLGVLNPTDPSYKFRHCEECEGFGTYLDEEKGRIVIGLPIFVDFKTRKNLIKIKFFGIVILLLIIFISVILIF